MLLMPLAIWLISLCCFIQILLLHLLRLALILFCLARLLLFDKLFLSLLLCFGLCVSFFNDRKDNIEFGCPIHENTCFRGFGLNVEVRFVRLLVLEYCLHHLMKIGHLPIVFDLLLFFLARRSH